MGKALKIASMTLLVLMVVFAGLSETGFIKQWLGFLDIGLYLRLVGLLAMLIALFWAWGYRNKVLSSQKYRRADEVLAQAQAKAVSKQRATEQAREKLDAEYVQKEKELQGEIDKIRQEYTDRINDLKAQNVRLKESVAKLMQVVKKKA